MVHGKESVDCRFPDSFKSLRHIVVMIDVTEAVVAGYFVGVSYESRGCSQDVADPDVIGGLGGHDYGCSFGFQGDDCIEGDVKVE